MLVQRAAPLDLWPLDRARLQPDGAEQRQRIGVVRARRRRVHDHVQIAALDCERVAVQRDLCDLGMQERLAPGEHPGDRTLLPQVGEPRADRCQVLDGAPRY
jgi:hypothetical protein